MGKEKIVVASLDIDAKSLIQNMGSIKKEIEDLREKQEKLTEKGREATKGFIENEIAIKKLEATYRSQAQAIAAQTDANGKLITQKEQIRNATNALNQSENDYIANNAELIRIKKELNSNSENYEKRLTQINAKLLENNNWLKENGSAYTKVVTTMSDYRSQVIESFDSINILNGGLIGLISRAQEAGGVGPLVTGALSGMTTGIMGMTKSAMAFIATPIGFVLAALAAVFALVQNAMNSSTESAGKITKIFTTFSVITDSLMKLLEPLGSFLIDGIAAGFDLAGQAAEAAMGFIADGLSLLGFDDAAEGVRGFTEEVKTTAAETTNLKKAHEQLAAQMAVQEQANEKAKQQIDDLIRKTKDQALTEEERTKALEQAAIIEKNNFNERKKLADAAYNNAVRQAALGKGLTDKEIANLQAGGAAYAEKMMKVKRFTQQEIDALTKANIDRIRLTGEEKTMIEKHNMAKQKLDEDFEAKREAAQQKREQQEADRRQRQQKMVDDAIQKQKLELDLFIEQQGHKARTMKEELDLAIKIADKKREIALAEYNASGKNANDKLKLDIANAQITNDLAKAQMDVAVGNAEKALEDYKANNATKIKDGAFITSELLAQEMTRLEGLKNAEIEYQKQRLKARAINQDEYNAEIKKIDDADKIARDQANAERKTAEDAVAATNLQNKMAADTANMEYDLGFQLTKLDAQKQQELDAAEKTGADKSLIEAKYAKLEDDTRKQVMDNKLSLAQSTFSSMATILGKESAAGKAMAIANATIDTYKSAVSAYSSMSGIPVVGPTLGAVAAAAAVAAGIQNVKKITSTKAPKAEKGALFSIGGNRHSAGGTMFQGADGTAFEAEQGEFIGVMNRNAAKHFMAFNNAFPVGGASAPNYFAGGGIVSREIASPPLNIDELASKIADANRSIPAPVVAVQDIITEGNSYVKVRDGANF